MKSEIDIRLRIAYMREMQKKALENKLTWTLTDLNHQIKALEWVLRDDEKITQ